MLENAFQYSALKIVFSSEITGKVRSWTQENFSGTLSFKGGKNQKIIFQGRKESEDYLSREERTRRLSFKGGKNQKIVFQRRKEPEDFLLREERTRRCMEQSQHCTESGARCGCFFYVLQESWPLCHGIGYCPRE